MFILTSWHTWAHTMFKCIKQHRKKIDYKEIYPKANKCYYIILQKPIWHIKNKTNTRILKQSP